MDEKRTSFLSHPEVLASAFVVALAAPIGPGAYLALRAFALGGFDSHGFARSRADELAAKPSEEVFVGLVGLALLAYLPRVALTIATMQAARGKRIRPLEMLKASLGRVLGGRRVSLMVATFTFFLVAGGFLRGAGGVESPLASGACAAIAALVATAGFGMCSLTDRAAAFDVSGRGDARASELRENARFGGPNYLDTSTARKGFDVATSADDATTVGMRAFLAAPAWLASIATLLADAVPVVLAGVTFELAGLGAAWLSPGAWQSFGVVAWAMTVAIVALRAALELGVAWAWTRAYESA